MDNIKKNIFLLKNHLLRPDSHKAYAEAMAYQELSKEIRLQISLKKRIELLNYAYQHCPFYKKLYDSVGIHPSMIKSEDNWKDVPILEKHMIREECQDMISDIANRKILAASKTGGSTGKPLVVYKSKKVHFEVLSWRALSWYNIAPWMNEGIVHRRVPTTTGQKLKNRAMWYPTRRAYLNAALMSEADINAFINELNNKQINWIVGYCGALEYIADNILAKGIVVDKIRLVWSTSSPLTKIVRDKLERAFNCPVMDQYGCCEMGNIAVQKPGENYLTINSDYVHVDIIDGDADITNTHELGDVCITDLNTKEFPLIKYRLGDRSRIIKTMSESEDGFPKMSFVQGRMTDMIYLPDGSRVDGSYLTTICDNYYNYISCYQIHQSKNYDITFKVIPKSNDKKAIDTIHHITESLSHLTKGNVKIRLEITNRIDDFAGKRKFIISEIALHL